MSNDMNEALIEQRMIGHGEGQEHTIADVNAGRIDDLIAPRLNALKSQLETAHELVKYAAHHGDCPRGWVRGTHDPFPDEPCRCGLTATLAALSSPLDKEEKK